MYTMQALVRSVATSGADTKDFNTGEIKGKEWPIQLERTGRNGKLEFVTVKAKTPEQAEGWRKYVGKEIITPCEFTVVKGEPRPWIEKGQLPRLCVAEKVAA